MGVLSQAARNNGSLNKKQIVRESNDPSARPQTERQFIFAVKQNRRSWRPDPCFQILATRSWATRSWLPDPATRSRQPGSQASRHPGIQASGQPASQTAKQPRSQAARQPSIQAAKPPSMQAASRSFHKLSEVSRSIRGERMRQREHLGTKSSDCSWIL